MTAVTDSGGNVVERYAYEAYGKTTVLNPDRTVKASQVPVQPYGFTGRRMDYEEGSGLYFYRLRYYDPEAGRFVSRDPLGMWGDAGQRGNAQNYCGNNPVNRIDPLGLDDEIDRLWAEAGMDPSVADYSEALTESLDETYGGDDQAKLDWATSRLSKPMNSNHRQALLGYIDVMEAWIAIFDNFEGSAAPRPAIYLQPPALLQLNDPHLLGEVLALPLRPFTSNEVSEKLTLDYASGRRAGSSLTLTESELYDLNLAGFDRFGERDDGGPNLGSHSGVMNQVARLAAAGGGSEPVLAGLRVQAMTGASVGPATLNYSGTITADAHGEWEFAGHVWLTDIIDFDSRPWGDRNYGAEVVVRAVDFVTPCGAPYEVSSVGVPASQSSRSRYTNYGRPGPPEATAIFEDR